MASSIRSFALAPIAAAVLLTAAALPATSHAQLNVPGGGQSSLYYRIGGGSPLAGAANRNVGPVRLGMNGAARLSYSCGRFDMGVTVQNLLNQFSRVGTAITGAVQAGIAALPMYVLQRAAPGLYELLQTYIKKAETQFDLGLQSCQQMEQVIRRGGDPYEDWINMAKGDAWKLQSRATTDVVEAKTAVETNGGRLGVGWVYGDRRGGAGQEAIHVVRDTVRVGYNVTMNEAVTSSPTRMFPSGSPTDTRLAGSFPSPEAAATWAIMVVGDTQVPTCDDADCQPKASVPGTGLLPRFEAERVSVESTLSPLLLMTGTPTTDQLRQSSAPGVALSSELIEAMRSMQPNERAIAAGRVAQEVALARTIDKALTIRNLLLTGAGTPEAKWEVAQKDVRERVAQLNRYIDDLLFETRVRKEVVSNTAESLIQAFRASQAKSAEVPRGPAVDRRPLENGRVQ